MNASCCRHGPALRRTRRVNPPSAIACRTARSGAAEERARAGTRPRTEAPPARRSRSGLQDSRVARRRRRASTVRRWSSRRGPWRNRSPSRAYARPRAMARRRGESGIAGSGRTRGMVLRMGRPIRRGGMSRVAPVDVASGGPSVRARVPGPGTRRDGGSRLAWVPTGSRRRCRSRWVCGAHRPGSIARGPGSSGRGVRRDGGSVGPVIRHRAAVGSG